MLLYTLCKILERDKIQCPDIGMCVGELPSVNDTLFSWPKRSHLIIEPSLFRAGFAIPEGAPFSGDHCICKSLFSIHHHRKFCFLNNYDISLLVIRCFDVIKSWHQSTYLLIQA